jgi:tripartite-type tricarboxylate transporter receptor subunit TctC
MRTVTIIVPFAVGGTINSVARVLAPKLGQRLGKPFALISGHRGHARGNCARLG